MDLYMYKIRTFVSKKPWHSVIVVPCVVPLLVYVSLFTFDVLTAPPTTASASEQATQYLKEHDLPTPPHSFRTDGCTAWVDKTFIYDFYDACLAHDIAYWAGGDKAHKVAADTQFHTDVTALGPLGTHLYAPLVYNAVHYGGDNAMSQLLGSQWGYGYREPVVTPLYIGTDITF